MPIFISYSRSDAAFVNNLAAHLVKHNAHVWIDSWELKVGDSIIERVQIAIQDSSALLIVLSKASVESEWCKKELNAGLMRELDEKRVVVLPVLAEECVIPPFLREKKYGDFRTDFDAGLKELVEALAGITAVDQGRLRLAATTRRSVAPCAESVCMSFEVSSRSKIWDNRAPTRTPIPKNVDMSGACLAAHFHFK